MTKDKSGLGCSYRGLGEIYKSTGNKISAKNCLERAITAFGEANDKIAIREIETLIE